MATGRDWFTGLVDVCGLDGDGFVEVARSWLLGVSRVLAGDLWGQLRDSLPLGEGAEWDDRHGAPHGVWASVMVIPVDRVLGNLVRPYSPESIEWMLEELPYRPSRAQFELVELDAEGVPYEVGGTLTVRVEVLKGHREWVQFTAGSNLYAATHSPMRPEMSAWWASVLREFVGRVDASFAHVCDDALLDGATALDHVLPGRRRIGSIIGGRETLRGYSWVTVLPSELADRLGGPAALRSSEAFSVVDELPFGGLFLQATPHFADYNPAAVHRVFRALASVLPAGQPKPDPFDTHPSQLVWDDAINWR